MEGGEARREGVKEEEKNDHGHIRDSNTPSQLTQTIWKHTSAAACAKENQPQLRF